MSQLDLTAEQLLAYGYRIHSIDTSTDLVGALLMSFGRDKLS